MEIDYELALPEYHHLNWRAVKRRQGRLLAAIITIGAVVVAAPQFARNGLAGGLITLFVFLGGMAVFMMLLLRYLVGVTFKSLQRSPSWGQTSVRLDPERLITATYMIKSEIRWEAITKIDSDAKGFYLHLNPIQVIMVPRRVFASTEEAQMFWNLAQEYYQHARRAPV